jgi:sortase (surface protein transpeptidase)
VADTAGPPLPPRRDRGRLVLVGLGELLLTAGLVVLLFAVYVLYVTDLLSDRRQDALADDLRTEWTDERNGAPAPATPPEFGDAFAFLHIPRLGTDYRRAVVEGTGQVELEQGPGHYAGTAMPGEPGNLAIAGHRVGRGSPFLDLDRMQPGDPIVVETRDAWFVYRVLGDPATGDYYADASGIPGREIVYPTQTEVIAPTPGGPAEGAPTGSYLTLTTCHPKYSAQQRLIVHAALEGGPIPWAEAPDGPAVLRAG